jgi:hypothetical protein
MNGGGECREQRILVCCSCRVDPPVNVWGVESASTSLGVDAMRNALVGTRAPNFSLMCTDGSPSGRRQVSLDDFLDRWLMLLFYPRDFSLI